MQFYQRLEFLKNPTRPSKTVRSASFTRSINSAQSINTKRRADRGVALLLTVFLITLCSIIVIGLARTSYLSSRLNSLYVQRSKAEYLLKSALNVARSIILLNKSTFDPPKDSWGLFIKGAEVPVDVLGIDDPNTTIALEINAEGSKIPLGHLRSSSGSSTNPTGIFLAIRDSCARLFKAMGFDNDQEQDQTGLFPGKVFTSEELVANLIDYMDADTDSYNAANFAQGIENQMPKDRFRNAKLEDIDELSSIPGFTPNRIYKIIDYVSIYNDQVNINLAPPEVLKALDKDLTDDGALKIRQEIEDKGGFDPASGRSELPNLLPNFDDLVGVIAYKSSRLIVRAKVQFGERRFFLDSVVYYSPSTGDPLPRIESMELYG